MEHIDFIPGTNLKLFQNRSLFSFGVDSILLSSFAPSGSHAIDFCTGNGIVLLRMKGLGKIGSGIGVEIQEEAALLATKSVSENGLSDELKILRGNLRDYRALLKKNSADLVLSNPPYTKAGGGLVNPEDSYALARHEVAMTFEELVEATEWVLKDLGRFVFVHKPERMAELIAALKKYRLEPKRLQFIQPSPGKPPNMMLIEAKKYGNEGMTVLPTLCVYDAGGSYTPELLQAYR